jgi:hypothetical protein
MGTFHAIPQPNILILTMVGGSERLGAADGILRRVVPFFLGSISPMDEGAIAVTK